VLVAVAVRQWSDNDGGGARAVTRRRKRR
jgi:hypothetical protein